MVITSPRKYVVDHWMGRHSLARSFFVNGIIAYLVVIAILVGLGTIFPNRIFLVVGLVVFLGAMVWSSVGIIRSALGTFRNSDVGAIKKTFATVTVIVVVAFWLFSLRDIIRLHLY